MGWGNDSAPGHEGYLVGLLECDDVRRRGDGFRELTIHDDAEAAKGIFLRWVQVGCACGWRSPRREAPIGACWWSAYVDAPEWFEEECRIIWRAHAIATAFAADPQRARRSFEVVPRDDPRRI
jgi:hypothetical protein